MSTNFFSKDLKKDEDKKKEKDRQKKIDNLLEIYDKIEEKNKNNNSSKLGISFSKNWSNNSYLDKLLKCFSPTFALIGVGLFFWGAGFAVNEISKSSSFLSEIALPEKITNIITTASFWRIICVVAIACTISFLFLTAFSAIKNSVKERIGEKNIKNRVNSMQKYHNINKQINNKQYNNTLNKYNYNDNFNKKNNNYKIEEKPKNTRINFVSDNQSCKKY